VSGSKARPKGRLGRRLAQGGAVVLAALAVIAGLSGCAWKITPPPNPASPAVVYVTDYGRHSRLALQVNESEMVEYSVGDWRYYANDERSLWRGLVALAVPGDAGLGRRMLPFSAEEEGVIESAGAERAARIEVEADQLATLLQNLDRRWQENAETARFSPETKLHFVKDPDSYHLFHNSNHRTANWLQALGCEVRGSPIVSNFRIGGREN